MPALRNEDAMPGVLHVGISIAKMRRLMRDPDFRRMLAWKGQSLAEWAAVYKEAEERGWTTMSECPTPLPSGECPGHEE